MESTHVKAHFFLGLGLIELEGFDEAIKHLHRGKKILYSIYIYTYI